MKVYSVNYENLPKNSAKMLTIMIFLTLMKKS